MVQPQGKSPMAETVSVALTTAAYAALGTTQTAVGAFVKRGQMVRLYVGASAPSASTADYIPLLGPMDGSSGPAYFSFADFGVGAGDEVYARAEERATTLIVLRGAFGAGAVSSTIASPVGPGTSAAAVRVVQATSQATYTDKSGTITTGGTAQTLAALNASRAGYFIQNVSAGDLWFSTLATAVAAQPSIKIAAGSAVTVTSPDVTTGAISIIGATTGQAYSAREW
jgi:hypothetical protein